MQLAPTLDKVGPVCRVAQDCRYVLQGLQGEDKHDPDSVPANLYLDSRARLDELNIGYTDNTHPQVRYSSHAALSRPVLLLISVPAAGHLEALV